MIAESRLVLYQGNPETKQIALFTATGPDLLPDGMPLTLYAQRPGSAAVAFSVACTAALNVVSIPFTVAELANVGHYNYSLYAEPEDADRALKLRGVVANGTGLEIVPVPLAPDPEPEP